MWALDALTEAADKLGIRVGRSQVRRILVADGARWRQVRSWAVRKTRTLSQKDSRRRPVHPHARGHHGRLRRRTRPADFPRLPCPAGLIWTTADAGYTKRVGTLGPTTTTGAPTSHTRTTTCSRRPRLLRVVT